jgi:suppressor of ftsI
MRRPALANTANTRTFKIAIPGARMKLVGGDSGGYAHDQFVENVTVSPSERAIIDVQFTQPGEYALKHVGPVAYTLGTITVSRKKTDQDHSVAFNRLQDRSADFADILRAADAPIEKKLDLTMQMSGMGNMQMGGMMHHGTSEEGIEWEDSMAMMNQHSTDESIKWILRDRATGLENDSINYVFTKGDMVKIELFNDGHAMHAMQHPIHFHGNRFIILSVNGVKNTNPVWKDTVLVPAGARVDILLDASNPGAWMTHCHISEHLGDGMMFTYRVQ